MSKNHLTKLYLILVICAGAVIFFWEIYSLPIHNIDLRFMLLSLITVLIGKRWSINLPNAEGPISPTATFIDLSLLLFGEAPAVLLAAVEGLSQHIKSKQKLLFNAAAITISTFLTALVLRSVFDSIIDLRGGYLSVYIIGICTIGLFQFVVNSGLIAIANALTLNQTIKRAWKRLYLNLSITHLTGAFTAGIISKLIDAIGLYAGFAVVSTQLILFFALYTYAKNSNERVKQAMRQVDALNLYIAAQERLPKPSTGLKSREPLIERTATQNALNIHADNFVKYDGILVKDDSGSMRHLRAFLCHSSDDKPAVSELYYRLRNDGVDAWFDQEHLFPGQDWEHEISKAVRKTDLVIVCLSRNSINKVGYVQKEIKFALDVADQQPEGSLFIVPLKLEDCDVPDRLKRWQWLNFFEEGGYERLVRALRYSGNMINSR